MELSALHVFLFPAKRVSLGSLKSLSATEMLDLGLIPFKEIIHLASHLAIKNEVAQFPEPFGSQQLPLRFFSCMVKPRSKKSCCPFCATEGKNFGYFSRMPKLGLEVIYNPSSGHHDWLSLLIIPSRSSGEVYTSNSAPAWSYYITGEGSCCDVLFYGGKQKPRCFSGRWGEIGLSKEDQRRQEGGTDFRQEKSRAHLTASMLQFKACLETHHTISPATGWGECGEKNLFKL